MRVLVVAEGKHERGTESSRGALGILVRRLLDGDPNIVLDRLANRNIHAVHGRGRGYYKKAVRWMLEAENGEFDAIVLLVDEDGIEARRIEINEAQSSQLSSIRRALGVAIRSFDAWMLADEQALSGILGTTVQRQPDAESIPDPKAACMALLSNSDSPLTQTEMYGGVSEAVNLSTLTERCPRGFAPFAARVRNL